MLAANIYPRPRGNQTLEEGRRPLLLALSLLIWIRAE